MTTFRLTGRRVAVFAVAWCIGLPALLIARVLVAIADDNGSSVNHGLDLTKVYTLPALLLWAGPPLLLLVVWEWMRRASASR